MAATGAPICAVYINLSRTPSRRQVRALTPPPPAADAPPPTVTVLERAPGGNRLAAGYSDGSVRLAASGITCWRRLHAQTMTACAEHRARPPQIRVWNLSNGECATTLHGHKARTLRCSARARQQRQPPPPGITQNV